jgi:predicted anti-sigma-YlaC factor YlaD
VDCNEVLEQLADYLDPDARAELCRAIEEHLTHCRDCRVEVDTVRRTIVLYQADREVQIPAPVMSRLEAALTREYRATGAPGSSSD